MRKVVAMAILVALTSCSGGFTKQKAEKTLEKWVGGRGSVTIVGIQESPTSATADLQFVDFNYTVIQPNWHEPAPRIYSGPGKAVFAHYNDGTWVLTEVVIQNGFVRWQNLNLPVQ